MAFLSPALVTLRDEVDEMSPDRDKSADGWIGDPAHASRHSDHNPEADGSVDAIDITHDPANGVDCNLLADQCKDDPRLIGGGYVIWNRRIWNPDISRSWRVYTGSNPHDHHMHVSVSDEGQNQTQPWLEEEWTVADIKAINEVTVRQGQKTRQLIRKLYKAESKQNRRLSDKEVDAILDALEAED